MKCKKTGEGQAGSKRVRFVFFVLYPSVRDRALLNIKLKFKAKTWKHNNLRPNENDMEIEWAQPGKGERGSGL